MGILTINAIPFNDYSDELKGHVVGERKVDVTTGYEYQLVQVAQTLTNDQFTANDVIVSKTAATYEGTNVPSAGLSANYPLPLGVFVSATAAPESTATATYYAWVMKRGYYATVKTNADDDIAVGDALIAATATACACDSIAVATAAASYPAVGVFIGIFGRAAAADVDGSDTVAAFIDVPF